MPIAPPYLGTKLQKVALDDPLVHAILEQGGSAADCVVAMHKRHVKLVMDQIVRSRNMSRAIDKVWGDEGK